MFRALRTGQLVFDIVAASVVFAFGGMLASLREPGFVLVVFGFCLSLAFWRCSPTLALVIAWAAAALQMTMLFAPDPINFTVFPVLYATAAYGGRRTRRWGLGSAVAAALAVMLYLVAVPMLVSPASREARTWMGQADGSISTGAFIFFASCAAFVLAWTAGYLATTARTAEERRIAGERAEREVAIEQERNRIARDMHDVVAHSLAVVIAQADGARYAAAADPDAAEEALATIGTISREALADVKVLLGQLRHRQMPGPQPLLADLDRLYEQFRGAGMDLRVRISGQRLALGAGAQLAVYRIVQEALTNALRHGDDAEPVELSFEWTTGELRLRIGNAVVGGEGEGARRVTHGIPGMRERAALSGGEFETVRAGARFSVRVTLPAQPVERVPGESVDPVAVSQGTGRIVTVEPGA